MTVYDELQLLIGSSNFITGADALYHYAGEFTDNLQVAPGAVLLPRSTEEVAAIMKVCNRYKIPVTVRGGGTGVSGGALAYNGAVIISTEKLNSIVDINVIDRTATVQAGVITQVLADTVAAAGLYFPQNISSAASCTIGGNIAVSSGSPRSLKYGTTRDYIMNLEVVLPNGEIIWTGRNVSKNATGYNLTQLIAGSEGTLGVITSIVLRLETSVPETALAMASFLSLEQLFNFVHAFFRDGCEAASMEFIDTAGFNLSSRFLGRWQELNMATAGVLWIELEGKTEEELLTALTTLDVLISRYTEEEVKVARSPAEIRHLWELRARVGDAVINFTAFKDIDIVVPRSQIHAMYAGIREAAAQSGLGYTVFGHIGNGNFHVNIFREEMPAGEWASVSGDCIRKIFTTASVLGGTISGEHGIGYLQRSYLDIALPASNIALMKQIKQLFDPNHVLNPQLIFKD